MFRSILILSFLIGAISGGEVMSERFGKWLSLNGYDDQGFDDNVEGNFGGLEYPEQLHHLPVVFVSGLQPSTFSKAVSFFLKRNYSMNELYGIISSPDHSIASIFNSTITCSLIRRQRTFLEAVIQYTQTNKVNVISFDLGVTIARKAIKGGVMTDEDGNICNIGVSLSNYINTFIAISGMNYGYPYCSKHSNSNIPFCNKVVYKNVLDFTLVTLKKMKFSARNLLVFVSGNQNKIKDVLAILPKSFNIEIKNIPIKEIQGSVEDVAYEKCIVAVNKTGEDVIVEDTSLFFDSWRLLPGPYIKTFVTCLASLDLYKLASVLPNQAATLISAVTYAVPSTSDHEQPRVFMFTGVRHGLIVPPRASENEQRSFEPVFRLQSSGKTISEMNENGTRLKYSARADALKEFAKAYKDYKATGNLEVMKCNEINPDALERPPVMPIKMETIKMVAGSLLPVAAYQ
uniref:Uncharacterized protein n=1 Tax=Rhabditophanes sp. KR3021 TaxID=114890 RepID=A0AC35TQD4_9BILA